MEPPAWRGVELGSWCLYLTLHGESAYAASPSSIISVGDAVSRYSVTVAHGPDIGSGLSHTPRERTAVGTTLVFFSGEKTATGPDETGVQRCPTASDRPARAGSATRDQSINGRK